MLIWTLVILASLWSLAYFRAALWQWTLAGVILLLLTEFFCDSSLWLAWLLFIAVAVILNNTQLRRSLLSEPLLKYFRKVLPPISDTEESAIEAGTVWWDGDLFTGKPDWHKLHDYVLKPLSEEEQAFVDGPTEELCRMLNDWEITQDYYDLPPKVWEFIKQNKFFGIIIPKAYGGLGFSAIAHSEIVMKLSTRSITTGVTVMVPNSLGPGELLMHYGTDEQKEYYLPRLASGEEIPCFALTSPYAGSDAGAIPDFGVLCEGEFEGKKTLGFRLTWEKRYITLAPVATVLGMAFRARDPEGLLGGGPELGITCALIPTNTPGVEIGNRHYPLSAAFQNGPTRGKDVFVPMDWVIGGQEQIGRGWIMLMNCLAAGRSISLPALGTGASKTAARTTGAYARVRKQFRLPVGKFEGVEEALARIAGNAYRMNAGRILTAGCVDLGEKPTVLSAVLKYQLTEGMRHVINDAMDIHGGRGICMGPDNYLGLVYEAIPISITVEGANILTRSMMIFGQGAIRCHPFVLKEMLASKNDDSDQGLIDFDSALFSHIGFTISNAARALFMGLTRACLVRAPVNDATATYYKRLDRASSAFIFLTDVTMMLLGGELKFREKISGRFADILSHLYLASATLKRYHDDGRPPEDLPLVQWAIEDSLQIIEARLEDITRNYPLKPVGLLLRLLVLPAGRLEHGPKDQLGRAAANLLMKPSATRDRLTLGAYWSTDPNDKVGIVEHSLIQVLQAEPLERKLNEALKMHINETNYEKALERGLAENVISEEEATTIRAANEAIRRVIQVDEFKPKERGRDLKPFEPERCI